MTTIYHRQGLRILEIDTKKASYKNIPWVSLGSFGKRKFENFVFLKNARGNGKLKISYV